MADHEPWPWYRELGLDVGLLEVWGSVVTAAFQVAVLAGCDPIVFVGTDLAYSDGLPYCRGSTHEFRWARTTAAGHELADLWRGLTTPSGAVRLPDLRGVETTTTPVLLAFRDWLVAHAARSGRRVMNATGAGLLVGAGIEQRSLVDALADPRQVPWPGDIVGDPGLAVNPSALAARFREKREEILTEDRRRLRAGRRSAAGPGTPPQPRVRWTRRCWPSVGQATTSLPTKLRRHRDACCAACPRRRRDGGPR